MRSPKRLIPSPAVDGDILSREQSQDIVETAVAAGEGAVVVVSHGLALSLHLRDRLGEEFDAESFWRSLGFPDAWVLDSSDLLHRPLPDGAYSLEVELNPGRTLVELDYDNNQISIPIELGDASLTTPTEPCPDDIAPRTSVGTARECGWTAAETFSCTPGQIGRVGCSAQCGLGTCTGNPMLRVCDAERADGNCTHPAAVDPTEFGGGESNDFAGPCPCDLSVQCPASGSIQVFTAPFRDGDPYSCDLAFEE